MVIMPYIGVGSKFTFGWVTLASYKKMIDWAARAMMIFILVENIEGLYLPHLHLYKAFKNSIYLPSLPPSREWFNMLSVCMRV